MAGAERETRRQLEEVWRERLHQAQSRYEVASADTRRLQTEYSTGAMPPADGDFALRKVLRTENAARMEYMRVLRLFSRLVLYGEHPEEDRSQTA